MGAESALLGSLITTAGGLLMQLISKIKCLYRHDESGCNPSCACMDGKIEKDNDELEVHTVSANDIDLVYVARSTSCAICPQNKDGTASAAAPP